MNEITTNTKIENMTVGELIRRIQINRDDERKKTLEWVKEQINTHGYSDKEKTHNVLNRILDIIEEKTNEQ